MLSDDALENLMQPIIDRQEQIDLYVLQQIAKKIKEIGKLSQSDIYKLERLFKNGSDVQKINKELARLTGLQVKEIKFLIKEVAKNSYLDMRPFYDYRYKPFIPFELNIPLQRVVKAVARQTVDTYLNLSNTRAFMLRDSKNPKLLISTKLAKTYQSVIDKAIQATQSGAIDYNTAMRDTIKQLVDSGIRSVTYHPESGRRYTKRLDSAVRMNLLDGIRQINQGVQDITGEQFGADGKELSAHPYSAPDHEPFQGRQFTNTEAAKIQSNQSFKDINGNSYTGVKRIIGQWNCRHFFWSIIIGYSKPNYTDKQLKTWAKENAKGYTLPNGKHLTMYECTQYQRQFETNIRRAKEGQMIAQSAGDMDLAKEYRAKIVSLTNQYKAFSGDCGLSVKMERAKVMGYKPISTK